MEKELLPIGSVVQLANSTGLVMVAGYLPVSPTQPNRLWDYCGFRFPIGFTDNDAVYCFDHSQVQMVYAYGYRDIEEELFVDKLKKSRDRLAQRVQAGQAGPAAQNRETPEPDGKEAK